MKIMHVDIADFGWCIRQTGESTRHKLKAMLEAEFGRDKIFEVSSGPFRITLEVGVRKMSALSFPYVAFVDADVLLDLDLLREGLAVQRVPRDISIFQGVVLDRFFHTVRPGGVHFYRREDLIKAIPIFPLPVDVERPEYELKKYLVSRGSVFKQYSFIVGHHDYYQYPFDIYRKGFFYASKMSDLSSVLEAAWVREARCSREVTVFLYGLHHGRLHRGGYDIDACSKILREGYKNISITECDDPNCRQKPLKINNIIFSRFLINWKILHHFLLVYYILRCRSISSFLRYLYYILRRICRFI
ncbi:hypothetical protein N9W31_00705 [Litoricolaceae bacterium]|nr:hypothetical protein [Litorivicinaceae bacterium]